MSNFKLKYFIDDLGIEIHIPIEEEVEKKRSINIKISKSQLEYEVAKKKLDVKRCLLPIEPKPVNTVEKNWNYNLKTSIVTPRTTLKTVLGKIHGEYHFERDESETNLDFNDLREKLKNVRGIVGDAPFLSFGAWQVECERLYKILEMHGQLENLK